MGSSTRIEQQTDDKLFLLTQEQKQYAQGSQHWVYLQEQIDQIAAQKYLEYVNS